MSTCGCDCKSKKMYIIIGIIVLFFLVLVFAGNSPRHDEDIAKGKQEQSKKALKTASDTAPKPTQKVEGSNPKVLPKPEKANTDVEESAIGIKKNLAVMSDEPAKGADNVTGIKSDYNEEKHNQINPALKEFAELQENNPERYVTQNVSGTGEIYGLDTYTGKVSFLPKGATKWIDLGSPKNAEKANAANYTFGITLPNSAVVMNSATAYTWKVTVKDNQGVWSTKIAAPSSESWK